MDHRWIRTYDSDVKMTIQISIDYKGGFSTTAPDLPIKVDGLHIALK